MGCGSSKSTVAVIDTPRSVNNNDKPNLRKDSLKQKPSYDHFSVHSSQQSLIKKESISNSDSNVKKSKLSSLEDLKKTNSCANLQTVPLINKSLTSLKQREKSAGSVKSGDSGVFDDRMSSAGSQKSATSSVSSKPPTASSRSSARKKLLRLDSDRINIENNNNEELDSVNVVSRPKSRFGNVAFDLMLDTPETGNQKKRPEKLAALETRRKKYSKKRMQSKSDIDKKIFEAGERRKIQEAEKQLKAKQFQHLSIHTTVTPFSPPESDGESEDNHRQDGEENDTPDLENTQIRNNGSLELSESEKDQVAS